MPIFIILYLLSVPVFFIIDMIWLGWLGRGVYEKYIGNFLGEVQWGAAVGFYLLYLIGLVFFAIYPAYNAGNVMLAIGLGAMFGFFTYLTYDMTNLATLDGWPWQIVVIDVLWGTILGAVVSGTTVFLALQFFS